jgi:hypothetical protein
MDTDSEDEETQKKVTWATVEDSFAEGFVRDL